MPESYSKKFKAISKAFFFKHLMLVADWFAPSPHINFHQSLHVIPEDILKAIPEDIL